MFPLVVPDPHVTEISLTESDEFIIIANKRYHSLIQEVKLSQGIEYDDVTGFTCVLH
jgi:hypothetical protein